MLHSSLQYVLLPVTGGQGELHKGSYHSVYSTLQNILHPAYCTVYSDVTFAGDGYTSSPW